MSGVIIPGGLRLEALRVPRGLDFAIVIKHEDDARDYAELHLQGLLPTGVIRQHIDARVKLSDLAATTDPTGAFQDAIDQLHAKLLLERPSLLLD